MDDWKVIIYSIAAILSCRVLIVLMIRHKHRYHRERLQQEQRKMRAQHLADATAEGNTGNNQEKTEAA